MQDVSFKDFVLDQLEAVEDVAGRAMFGGYGLYAGDVFFGMVFDGRMYLKTDETSRAQFVEQGMEPFRPNARQTLHSYYEVPPEVLERRDSLVAWAHTAIACGADS